MAKTKTKRIGILTAGGDCPGLNAVIRAVVKPALYQGWEVVGFKDGYWGLIKNKTIKLSIDNVRGILTLGGTILGTSNKDNPFKQPTIGKDGKVYFEDLSDVVLKNFRSHRLEALICIGGDGTMSVASKLAKKGIPVVGVPKTIDNDIYGTDITFGFDTAVTIATVSVDRLHSTAQSHHRVMVLEVMGRYAGWIALASGLAGGADVILIPEIPFDMDVVCKYVKDRSRKGSRFSIVVVAEGAYPKGGAPIIKAVVKDSADPIRMGGVGDYVTNEIEKRTGIESRVTVLGHLQRGGSPTPFDRLLATRFGIGALHLVRDGVFNRMVNMKAGKISSIDISQVGGKVRFVDKSCDYIKAAKELNLCLGE